MSLFRDLIEMYKGPKLSLLFTGCGARAAELLKEPGSSGVLYDLHIPYAQEATQALTGPLEVSSVSKEMVLALHDRKVPEGVCRVTVTAAITSTRYRRGDNHAYIAVDSDDGVRVWHLKLPKMEEENHKGRGKILANRVFEDSTICDVAILLGTNQPLGIHLLLGGASDVELKVSNDVLIYPASKQDRPTVLKRVVGRIDVIPGSFDPAHDGHFWIFENHSKPEENALSYFEISRSRVGKEDLSEEEVLKRVQQFKDKANVLVTSSPLFSDKYRVLSQYADYVRFHIGIDTYDRLLQMSGVHVVEGMERAQFIVYPRAGVGLPEEHPSNCFPGMTPPEHIQVISSTEIREKTLRSFLAEIQGEL